MPHFHIKIVVPLADDHMEAAKTLVAIEPLLQHIKESVPPNADIEHGIVHPRPKKDASPTTGND